MQQQQQEKQVPQKKKYTRRNTGTTHITKVGSMRDLTEDMVIVENDVLPPHLRKVTPKEVILKLAKEMEVNKTSLWLPVKLNKVSAYLIYAVDGTKMKFTCQTEFRNGVEGTRCWRVR